MYKNIFFMLLLIQSSYNTFSQGFLRVGYGWGYANPREINRLIDVHNTLNREYYNTGNDLNKIHSFGGMMFGFGKEDENIRFEITRQNKHSVSSSNFMYNNEEIERRLKIRSYCLSFALYGGSENVKFGASLDMGTFKGLYKRAPKSAIKDTSYIHLFQTFQQLGGPTFLKDGDFIRTLQIGMTPFVQLEKGPIGVRLFYQFQFMRLSIDDLDYVLMGGQKIQNNHNLKDKMNNFGILLYLKLGGYYD